MQTMARFALGLGILLATAANAHAAPPAGARVVFLHHSTGQCIWEGGVPERLAAYNRANGTDYRITEQAFPKQSPYGWNNYPYDYWNLWVRHAGVKPFQGEPTLEMLTPQYDVIVWKHCFPVTSIEADTGRADVAAEDKRSENYRAQYLALRSKMRQFPKTRFLVWTGAVQLRGAMDDAAARRAQAFFAWVRTQWDRPGDNIYVWDFNRLQTEGGLYLNPAHAEGPQDSHPNAAFARKVAPLFVARLVEVIEGRGDSDDLTAEVAVTRQKVAVEAPAETAAPPAPVDASPPAQAAVAPAKGSLVLDDAEDPDRLKVLWGSAATYLPQDNGHTVRINFAAGKSEDWGEYGKQRLVDTRPPQNNIDIRGYRYLAMRLWADRDMEVVCTLVTRPRELPDGGESSFGFTAYPRAEGGKWKTLVVDLTKLELNCEGDTAYAAAGKPTRPMHLTSLRLVTHEKNAAADVRIDDLTLYPTLPESLTGHLLQP